MKMDYETYSKMTNEDKQRWNWDFKKVRCEQVFDFSNFINVIWSLFACMALYIILIYFKADTTYIVGIFASLHKLIIFYILGLGLVQFIILANYSTAKKKEKEWLISKGYIQVK